MPTYPGGKGALYHKIINLIPPHNVYVEPFAGGAAVLRAKRPAAINVAIDLYGDAIQALAASLVEAGAVVHLATPADATDGAHAIPGDPAAGDEDLHVAHGDGRRPESVQYPPISTSSTPTPSPSSKPPPSFAGPTPSSMPIPPTSKLPAPTPSATSTSTR